jgi:hypothetical protein
VIVPAESICPASRLGRLVPAARCSCPPWVPKVSTGANSLPTQWNHHHVVPTSVFRCFCLFSSIFSPSPASSRLVSSHRLASLRFASHVHVRNPINDRPPHALARAAFFVSSGLSPFHCIPPICPPGSLPPRRVVPYRISVHLRAIGGIPNLSLSIILVYHPRFLDLASTIHLPDYAATSSTDSVFVS